MVSNCVVNLSPDKPRVSPRYSGSCGPAVSCTSPTSSPTAAFPPCSWTITVLAGERLAGARHAQDFRRILDYASACPDLRTVSVSPVTIGDPDIGRRVGFAAFTSRTVRAFKLPLEDRCE